MQIVASAVFVVVLCAVAPPRSDRCGRRQMLLVGNATGIPIGLAVFPITDIRRTLAFGPAAAMSARLPPDGDRPPGRRLTGAGRTWLARQTGCDSCPGGSTLAAAMDEEPELYIVRPPEPGDEWRAEREHVRLESRRRHLERRRDCTVHIARRAELELLLGSALAWCPACGARTRATDHR